MTPVHLASSSIVSATRCQYTTSSAKDDVSNAGTGNPGIFSTALYWANLRSM